MIYSFEEKVRYSEARSDNRLGVEGIVNYFQDCSFFQSESINRGITYIEKEKKGWVLSSWQIVICERPMFMTDVKVSTWATKFKGLYGTRNYTLTSKEEKTCFAYANSIWVYMDFQHGHPLKVSEEEARAYGIDTPLEMLYEPRKIALPGDSFDAPKIPVRKSQIDTNHHVNNSQYIAMALESIGMSGFMGQIRVEYKKSAKFGDVIYPWIYQDDIRSVVTLKDKDGAIFAVIEFKEAKKC